MRLQVLGVLLSALFTGSGLFLDGGEVQPQDRSARNQPKRALATMPSTQPATGVAEYMSFLKEGKLSVHVWDYAPTPREILLATKMKAAIAKKPEWLLDYVKKTAVPGKPLPYHENFGLTPQEYEEFSNFARVRRLRITSEAILKIKRIGDGRFELSGTKATRELEGLVIDLASREIETPLGTCDDLEWEPQIPDRTFGDQGPWEGWTWNCDATNPDTAVGSAVRLIVGKLVKRNEWCLFYRASNRAEGEHATVRTVDISFSWP